MGPTTASILRIIILASLLVAAGWCVLRLAVTVASSLRDANESPPSRLVPIPIDAEEGGIGPVIA